MRTEHILFSENAALKGYQSPEGIEILCSFLTVGTD